MTALAKSRQSSIEAWNDKQFTLASGNKAWKGGLAGLDMSTGKVEPGHAESDLLIIGSFTEDVDATSADKLVNVRFDREIRLRWYANSTTTALVSTDVGKLCYVEDDQTVTASPNNAPVAGRVWAVSSLDGVAVELLPAGGGSLSGAVVGTLAAFSANNINVPTQPTNGTIYDVPTTAAASTITLPASADPGCTLRFVADGTKNGHTVQYRDITGTVVITTALTALKRHNVVTTFLNGLWTANAYVAP